MGVHNSSFVGNHAHDGGAVYLDMRSGMYVTPGAFVADCTFRNNTADAFGGAIAGYLDGALMTTLNMQRSLFEDNHANMNGGAIGGGIAPDFTLSDFARNSVDGYGGGAIVSLLLIFIAFFYLFVLYIDAFFFFFVIFKK